MSRSMRFASLVSSPLLAAGIWLAGPAPAAAHPHVWVTSTAAFHVEEGKFTRLSLRWKFDPFFSQVLTGDFDKNRDGTFDAGETAGMKDQIFTNLKDYAYFTHLRAAGQAVPIGQVDGFRAEVDQASGELVFSFDLIPETPVDLRSTTLGFAQYDPTIYVDVALIGDTPVRIEGGRCSWKTRELDQISANDAFLSPQEIEISCS